MLDNQITPNLSVGLYFMLILNYTTVEFKTRLVSKNAQYEG